MLLENIAPIAKDILEAAGFQVETHKKALSEEQLLEKLPHFHFVGIRSKTQLREQHLKAATNLLAIGCFCIGTNQVDLKVAGDRGVAVFNSPFSNSRSVAELVIGYIISLARQLGDRNRELHAGEWNKVSSNCYEIRGKTLGIVGYGHIGTQLSVLAEAMGLRVIFHDVLQIMPLGHAKQVTWSTLLSQSDIVTLHVPETPETISMVGELELNQMKPGSYLINASRGSVVNIEALAKAIKSGHIAGAAVDVYPTEPLKNGQGFETPLQQLPNVLLTPHIGGSTEEAQHAIGMEVANAFVRYAKKGTTLGAVNFPEVDLRVNGGKVARIAHIHRNVPGVLRRVNELVGDHNIEKQICDHRGDVAYLVMDVSVEEPKLLGEMIGVIKQSRHNILTRVILL